MGEHLLVCGLGSIGRRHVRHFRALGIGRVDAYRTGLGTLPAAELPAVDHEFTDLTEALAAGPAIVVVANPTVLHAQTALAAVRAGCHVLVEKPVAHTIAEAEALAAEAAARGVVVSCALNLRYHPALQCARAMVQSETPLGAAVLVRAHFGSYLPDWHPWEDFRRGYAARRDLGGGAALTNIHEIDAALWLFGHATRVEGVALEQGPLGLDVDEACAFVIRHATGVVSSVTLSLVQKPPTRSLEIGFERGTFACDLLTGAWSTHHADGRIDSGARAGAFDFDETYRSQAEDFLRAVRGECPPPVPVEAAAEALAVALTIQESL